MSREESNKLQSFRQRNSHQPNNNNQPQIHHKFERQVSDNTRSSNFRSDAHHMPQQQKTPKLQRRHSQKKDNNGNIQNTKTLPKEHKHVPSQQWGEDLRLPRGQERVYPSFEKCWFCKLMKLRLKIFLKVLTRL